MRVSGTSGGVLVKTRQELVIMGGEGGVERMKKHNIG